MSEKLPNNGLMHRNKQDRHSITSSTRTKKDLGMVRPKCLRARRASWKLVTGRSLVSANSPRDWRIGLLR